LSTATGDADTRVSDVWVAAWSMTYDWLTLRIVHAESELTITTDLVTGLSAGLAALEFPPGTQLVSQDAIDDMLVENDRATFDGVAVAIDTGQFFVVGEYTELGIADSFLEDPGKRWYVSGGIRFGNFTTYATVEGYESDLNVSGQEAITDQLDVLAPFVPALSPAEQAGFNALYGGTVAVFSQSQSDQDTYSVGVRYNFHPSAAAKVEYTQQDDKINDVEPASVAVAIDLVY
ncbi:MAG TPA: porin, partial [Dongiaceae bacterium]|nr:porin [Dongiaceae bacterium]